MLWYPVSLLHGPYCQKHSFVFLLEDGSKFFCCARTNSWVCSHLPTPESLLPPLPPASSSPAPPPTQKDAPTFPSVNVTQSSWRFLAWPLSLLRDRISQNQILWVIRLGAFLRDTRCFSKSQWDLPSPPTISLSQNQPELWPGMPLTFERSLGLNGGKNYWVPSICLAERYLYNRCFYSNTLACSLPLCPSTDSRWVTGGSVHWSRSEQCAGQLQKAQRGTSFGPLGGGAE